MNVFVADPNADMAMAHHTVNDRVNQAWARAQAQSARTERRNQRRAERHAQRAAQRQTPPRARLPWWAFLRPAH
jgi:phage protein D